MWRELVHNLVWRLRRPFHKNSDPRNPFCELESLCTLISLHVILLHYIRLNDRSTILYSDPIARRFQRGVTYYFEDCVKAHRGSGAYPWEDFHVLWYQFWYTDNYYCSQWQWTIKTGSQSTWIVRLVLKYIISIRIQTGASLLVIV